MNIESNSRVRGRRANTASLTSSCPETGTPSSQGAAVLLYKPQTYSAFSALSVHYGLESDQPGSVKSKYKVEDKSAVQTSDRRFPGAGASGI